MIDDHAGQVLHSDRLQPRPTTVPLSPREEGRLNQVDPITAAPHLRLVWPQWQGAGTESVRSLAPEFPFDIARRGYSVGTKVLQAVLPEHDGPTAVVPVEMGDIGLEERDRSEGRGASAAAQRAGDHPGTPTCAHHHGWRRVLGKHGAVLVPDQQARR
jgi:hypothetical protein